MSFKYRDFELNDDRSTMKIGSDSLALGEWMTVLPIDRNMLDIGTGCGILALLAASRRVEAADEFADEETDGVMISSDLDMGDVGLHITAIDIDSESIKQASENFSASPWPARFEVQCLALQDFVSQRSMLAEADFPDFAGFDLIFANPPYYAGGLKAPAQQRALARSADTLPFDDLISGVLTLLAPAGRFAICLPEPLMRDFIFHAAPAGLHPRRTELRTSNPDGTPRHDVLMLAEFSR
jgi:tRNA1Val (adenine37-N6)-methyltransferase